MKYSQWLSLIVLVAGLYGFWQLRNVLLLALTATLLIIVLNRAVRFLQRWLPARKIAILLLLGLGLMALGILGVIIVPPFLSQLQELVDLTPQIIDSLQRWLVDLENFLPGSLQGSQNLESWLDRLRSLDLEVAFGRFFRLFSNTLSVTLNLFLLTTITLLVLLDPQPYRRLFVKTFPASVRQQVDRVLNDCEEAIVGWFAGIIFNVLIIASLSAIGLWILGIPLAFANGVLAGLLAFIPNLGPVISVVPPAAIALLEAPWKALAVIALYILIQQIESNLLTPMVMQRQVSLLPAVTLLSQVVFAILFGFWGLLLALPLTLILRQWLQEFWVERFLERH